MQVYEYILLILGVANLGGLIITGYKTFRDPDEKTEKEIGINSATCEVKHKRIDEIFVELKETIKTINSSLLLIKENDIKHIEQEMRRMSDVQTRILTILEIRNQQDQTKVK